MGSHDISRINTHIEFQDAKEYSEHKRFMLKISPLYFEMQSFRHTALSSSSISLSFSIEENSRTFFLEVIILFLPATNRARKQENCKFPSCSSNSWLEYPRT